MIKELSVLIVEDDDVAAESITRGLRKVAPDINLVFAEHGNIAIEILENKHPTRILKPPFLVLLDLNMPVMNGFEFLEYVRDNPNLRIRLFSFSPHQMMTTTVLEPMKITWQDTW